jgi:uncharacterized protein (TIGR02996 family)
MTTLAGALLAAILESPEDDVPRLVLADYLEERNAPGDEWRAELIRVQCRIATIEAVCGCGCCVRRRGGGQHHNGPCGVDQERDELPGGKSKQAFLRKRERELFAHLCMLFHVATPIGTRCVLTLDADTTSSLPVLRFRRGFVEHIALPCADFMRHAEALFRAQPITAVELTDREPNLGRVPYGWTWVTDSNWRESSVVRECIPWSLYDLVQRHRDKNVAESPGDSRRWLNAACVRYGRRQAGLTG